jgi:hypothetical protein
MRLVDPVETWANAILIAVIVVGLAAAFIV